MRPFLFLSLCCSLLLNHFYCSHENEHTYWSNNYVEPTAGDLSSYEEYRYFNGDYNGQAQSYEKQNEFQSDAVAKVDHIKVSLNTNIIR